jgi:hypothetical protein
LCSAVGRWAPSWAYQPGSRRRRLAGCSVQRVVWAVGAATLVIAVIPCCSSGPVDQPMAAPGGLSANCQRWSASSDQQQAGQRRQPPGHPGWPCHQRRRNGPGRYRSAGGGASETEGGTHEQPARGAEPAAGRATQDRTAGAGRPCAAAACRSPAAPPLGQGGPWLVAAGSVAECHRAAARPSPEKRQLTNRRQPCPDSYAPWCSGSRWRP